MQPHSDDFLSDLRREEVEFFFPLRLCTCTECGLLQIDYLVNPKILYQQNYIYESSITERGVNHYYQMAKEIAERFSFDPGKLSVDIGSNVGVLLTGFKKQGFTVLGVDPAETVAEKARLNGVPTLTEFFKRTIAKQIAADHGLAHVITGTNVFAHLHDIDSAVEGMKELLAQEGVIVIEAPYALDLIKNIEYDTVYHQHIGYLSVRPMQRYFEKFGLELFDVSHHSIHGGTLRYYVGHVGSHVVESTVKDAITKEIDFGLYKQDRLKEFSQAVMQQKRDLITLLNELKADNKRIVAVSAPAKGNTLLNYCGMGVHYLEYATEKSSLKQGLFTPGMHIPIYDDSRVLDDMPDYVLILAWNFAEEIMSNLDEYRARGGKFIIPIPTPRVIE